jgi:hypothetical protein
MVLFAWFSWPFFKLIWSVSPIPLTGLAGGQAQNEARRPYFATGQN